MALDATHDLAEVTTLPLVDADDMHKDMMSVLRAILDELGLVGYTTISVAQAGAGTTTPTSTWVRLRCRWLVLSADAAALVTLNIGTARYSFAVVAGVNNPIPFTPVIERGSDISITTSAGNIFANLIAKPE